MRAMILAAGVGSRLKEITKDLPKPMVAMSERSRIIDTVIGNLVRVGIREIAVNLHHHRELLREYLLERHPHVCWHFSVEEELLNTGGGINGCREFLEQGEDFIVTNSDILYFFDLDRCIQLHRERDSLCTLLLVPSSPERAVLFRDDEGVLGFTSPRGRLYYEMSCEASPRDRYGTYTGVSLFHRRIFEHMREGAYSIIDVLADRIKQGERIDFILLEQDYWNDIGTFPGLERGRRDFEIVDDVARALGGEVNAFRHLFRGASGKSVYRIVVDHVPRVVTCSDDPRELRSWEAFSRYLCQAQVPVPQVILSKPSWLLVEDGGERSLYDVATEQHARGEFPLDHYRQLIDILHRMAEIDVATFPAENCIGRQRFDRDNIHFDIRYFNQCFHEGRLNAAEVNDLASAIHELISSEPASIMHRDFQSTNILINHDLEPRIVDLQTLRIGYSIYDLVSLVFDPYVQMDGETMEGLLGRYYQPIDPSTRSRDLVWVAAFVRLLQCLATFRAMGDRNAGFYTSKIPRALDNLAQVIERIRDCQARGSLGTLRIPDSILRLQTDRATPPGGGSRQ